MSTFFCLILFFISIYYISTDIDFDSLLGIIKHYDLSKMLLLFLCLIIIIIPNAFRLTFLSTYKKRINVFLCYKATILCLALNNILPAKLGELAKLVYLKDKARIAYTDALNYVFWERFADINLIAMISLFLLSNLDNKSYFYATATICSVGWLGLFLCCYYNEKINKLTNKIPNEYLRLTVENFLNLLNKQYNYRFFVCLILHTTFIWFLYFGFTYVILIHITHLNLSMMETVTVFIASAIAMTIPSTPGAFGPYEALMMITLSAFGISREHALSASLLLHLVQYIPTTILGLLVMMQAGYKIRFVSKKSSYQIKLDMKT